MIIKTIFISLGIIVYAVPAANAENQLTLIHVMPIDASVNLNPSGLAYCNEEVLLVSDKIGDQIFKININQGNASLSTKMVLDEIPKPDYAGLSIKERIFVFLKLVLTNSAYDWEGIDCDDAGNIFLASETFGDILKMTPNGDSEWLHTGLLVKGKEKGLFKTSGAYLEGIAVSGKEQITVAAERQPRALIRLSKNSNKWEIAQIYNEESPVSIPKSRSQDFTGLVVHDNSIYSLERNASAICARNIKNLNVSQCWSYAHIENSNDYKYNDDTYGLAEGITFTKDHLLIVLDNNNDYRTHLPEDRRALLFVFEKPSTLASHCQ